MRKLALTDDIDEDREAGALYRKRSEFGHER